MRHWPWIALSTFAATACFQPLQDGVPVEGQAGGSHTGGSRTSGGGGGGSTSSGSGAASTGSGGSTGGGSAGSTTGGGSTGGSSGGSSTGGASGSASCAAPDFTFNGTVEQLTTQSPVANLSIAAYNPSGPPFAEPVSAQVSSDSSGDVTVCIPGGQEVYLGMSPGQNFPPTATSNFILHGSDPNARRLSLLSTGDEAILQSAVDNMNVGPKMDITKPIVAVGITATSAVCQNQLAGWQFALTDLDGGPLPSDPDAGSPYVVIYLDSNSLPSPGAGQTSSRGAAAFYNVETSVTTVRLQATNTNPDAGCVPTTSPLEFTGTLEVSTNAITFAPIDLP